MAEKFSNSLYLLTKGDSILDALYMIYNVTHSDVNEFISVSFYYVQNW